VDLEQGRPLEGTAQDACRDIEILHAALASPGHRVLLGEAHETLGLRRKP